jgi:hypothetical protein
MKALSIKQPWASLIAHGIKPIENRTWKTHFRGRIYIHASAKNAKGLSLLNNKQLNSLPEFEIETINSAIIGEVDIIDCVINHPSIWEEKTEFSPYQVNGENESPKPIYNWVLANPVLYDKPILNVKGKLSFWEFNGCNICHNETTPEFICESCGELVCDKCTVKYNQFSQIDYTLCNNCK